MIIDVKYVKQYLIENPEKVQEILEHFEFHDINININNRELRCALPDGSNSQTIAVNLKTLKSIIYNAQDFKGDLFDMLMYWNEHIAHGYPMNLHQILMIIDENILHLTSQGKVMQYKELLYKTDTTCKNKVNKEEKIEEPEPLIYELDYLKRFVRKPYISWIREGIIPFVQDKYSICYDDEKARVLIPQFKYDDSTKIVGLKGRTTREKYDLLGIPKYINYIVGYEKSKNLYGLSHNIEAIKDKRKLVIFESEKSLMKLETFNIAFPDATVPSVALGGSSLSDWQAECIGQISKRIKGMEVIVCMDKDVEKEHVLNMCAKLTDLGCDHVSYIVDDNDLLAEKDSPIDKGFDSWSKLFKERKRA